MRFLMEVRNPHDTFNAAVRDGSVGEKMKAILDDINPEAVYFTEIDGKRSVVLIVEIDEVSQIPSVAEPFFLNFNADIRFHPAMSVEDLGKAGLDELGKKWG